MNFPFGVDVVVVRAGRKSDPFSGNPDEVILDWDHTTEHTLEGCAWAPGVSEESTTPSAPSVTVAGTIYADFDADVDKDDRVRIGADTFQVIGRPARWQNPFTGWEAGAVITVEEIT